MRAEELDYVLPEALIAQEPALEREAARLFVLARDEPRFSHRCVGELAALLPPALFVFNDTRVLPARLHAVKPTGGKVELLLIERTSVPGPAEQWLCMARPLKGLRAGMTLSLGEQASLALEVGERVGEALLSVTLRAALANEEVEQALARVGELPLPPYITRKPEGRDSERYQTVFAREPGAVAAPTAGLHFGEPLLASLAEHGHERAFVTLHVGPGTFTPLNADTLDQHTMHSERYSISEQSAEAIQRARRAGRPVVAVGTTVVRTLEACARAHGAVVATSAATDICIYPPYTFRVVDALVTNFHLPRSTLLALVMAFAGVDCVRAAYAEAVRERYRFFSYGDAMLIQPRRLP